MIPASVFTPAVVIAFLLWNAITYLLMAWDKFCALTDRWRISESTLLTCALFGGAVGAKAAQSLCRHKTRKQPFARALNLCLSVNVLALISVLYVWISG